MKKKMFLIIILMIALLYVPSVFAAGQAADGCTGIFGDGVTANVDVKIVNVVHGVILVIQIAVPIVLVIFGMLDLFKGISAQKEDEIAKGRQMFIKRIIAAALVFFVVAIVKLLVGFVADDNDPNIISCFNCFVNGADSASGHCSGND